MQAMPIASGERRRSMSSPVRSGQAGTGRKGKGKESGRTEHGHGVHADDLAADVGLAVHCAAIARRSAGGVAEAGAEAGAGAEAVQRQSERREESEHRDLSGEIGDGEGTYVRCGPTGASSRA